MRIRAPSSYVMLGTGLALMLQTNYRVAGPVGPGELLTAAFVVLHIMHKVSMSRALVLHLPDTLPRNYIAIVFFVITPTTLLSSALNVQGTNFVDLATYYFICAVLLFLPKSEREVRVMITTFLFVTFATISAQYLFGGSNAYYSLRFTGGAKNPNQLAFYLVAALVLLIYVPQIWIRLIVAGCTVFFGLASMSDALLAAIMVPPLVFITLIILPPRAVLYLLPVLLLFIFVGITSSGLLGNLTDQWESADEGGSRVKLYVSAIQAWLDTPFSIMFGHGSGSFSGIDGPFQLAEAHSTALDLATIAGVFGLFLFPFLPFWFGLTAISKNLRFAPAMLMALVAFASFHFCGRQPLFWVTLVMVERLIREAPTTSIQSIRTLRRGKEARP